MKRKHVFLIQSRPFSHIKDHGYATGATLLSLRLHTRLRAGATSRVSGISARALWVLPSDALFFKWVAADRKKGRIGVGVGDATSWLVEKDIDWLYGVGVSSPPLTLSARRTRLCHGILWILSSVGVCLCSQSDTGVSFIRSRGPHTARAHNFIHHFAQNTDPPLSRPRSTTSTPRESSIKVCASAAACPVCQPRSIVKPRPAAVQSEISAGHLSAK